MKLQLLRLGKEGCTGDFDKDPFEDRRSVNGVDGWEAEYAVTTPDDSNDELRAPILGSSSGKAFGFREKENFYEVGSLAK